MAAVVAAMLAWAGIASAAEPIPTLAAPLPRRETGGLALSAGFGYVFAGLGLQARYDVPIRPRLVVSPFGSVGILFGASTPTFGVATAWGGRHRLAVDLGVGPLGWGLLSLHGTPIRGPMVFGPIAGVGYEHMSDGRALQRVMIEYARATWGAYAPITNPSTIFLSLGFGWRIW
jgi:hypothetical protein